MEGSPNERRFGGASRDEVLARRDRAKANLDAFVAASDADLAPLLHDALQAPIANYDFLKTRPGVSIFSISSSKHAILFAMMLACAASCSSRFTHFFIDEFQDTDPLQAEILLLLAADDPGRDGLAAARPIPANSSWSAIRSSRSTASGAPMLRSMRM